MNQRILPYLTASTLALVLLLLGFFGSQSRPELWFTPDQLGDRFMSNHKYSEAAKVYADPIRQGIAYYRAGDFKLAATAFSHAATPEAVFNQANSLVMLGKYADAIKTYDRALSLRPDWKFAEDNREVAIARRDRMKIDAGDDTGAELKPDAIVYEKGRKKSGETVQINVGSPLNDGELQALWLRRVQTKPADFLRAKFAYQSQRASGGTP